MLKDRNGIAIKEGDWVVYKYGEDNEIGGLQVVLKNGVLGFKVNSIFSKMDEFVELSTTDLKNCEVVKYGKKTK